MIITLTLILWLASSLIEYKLVKSNEAIRRNFHGVKAIFISCVISGGLGLIASGTMGLVGTTAAVIATIIGLATNEFTFNLFAFIERANSKRHDFQSRVRNNPQRYSDASIGLRGLGSGFVSLLSGLGKIIRLSGWLSSRPAELGKVVQQRRQLKP